MNAGSGTVGVSDGTAGGKGDSKLVNRGEIDGRLEKLLLVVNNISPLRGGSRSVINVVPIIANLKILFPGIFRRKVHKGCYSSGKVMLRRNGGDVGRIHRIHSYKMIGKNRLAGHNGSSIYIGGRGTGCRKWGIGGEHNTRFTEIIEQSDYKSKETIQNSCDTNECENSNDRVTPDRELSLSDTFIKGLGVNDDPIKEKGKSQKEQELHGATLLRALD